MHKFKVFDFSAIVGENINRQIKTRFQALSFAKVFTGYKLNKGITVTTVTVTYGNIWFYSKWIFQECFLCSHCHGYRVEYEIELLVHNTDCTLTIETKGQNPIHRSLKTCIIGFLVVYPSTFTRFNLDQLRFLFNCPPTPPLFQR